MFILVSCSAEMPVAGEEAAAAPPEDGAVPAGGLDLTRWTTCSCPIPVIWMIVDKMMERMRKNGDER